MLARAVEAAGRRRVRLRDLGRHRRAHGRHGRRRGPAAPRSHDGDAAGAARVDPGVPAGVEPGRQRRPAVADWRGRKILDAIVADPNVDIVDRADHRRARVDVEAAHARPGRRRRDDRQADLRDLGLAGHRRRAGVRHPAVDGQVITFRTFDNCVDAVRAYFDYQDVRERATAARSRESGDARRSPRATVDCRPTRPCPSTSRSSCWRRTASPSTRDELVASATAAVEAANAIGYPVVMKAARPRSPTRATAASCASGSSRRSAVRDAFAELAPAVGGAVLVSEMVHRRRRVRRRRQHRRAVRPGRDVRPRRRVRRGVRGRDVPGAAVRRGRGPAHDRRGARQRAAARCRGRPKGDRRSAGRHDHEGAALAVDLADDSPSSTSTRSSSCPRAPSPSTPSPSPDDHRRPSAIPHRSPTQTDAKASLPDGICGTRRWDGC